MEPSEFLFLVLPLGVLIFILVFVVFHLARKEEIVHGKEVEMVNEFLMSGIMDRENFASVLQGLLRDRIIDRDTYERLGKLLEETFARTH